jgi:microcystin-dependent protein
LFGGTWERIQDRFLLAAGNTYAAGTTGGEAEHTLTIAEMPKHNHKDIGLSADFSYRLGWDNGSNKGINMYNSVSNAVNIEGGSAWRTGDEGGGQAHNNMPPFLTVNIWKRTA